MCFISFIDYSTISFCCCCCQFFALFWFQSVSYFSYSAYRQIAHLEANIKRLQKRMWKCEAKEIEKKRRKKLGISKERLSAVFTEYCRKGRTSTYCIIFEYYSQQTKRKWIDWIETQMNLRLNTICMRNVQERISHDSRFLCIWMGCLGVCAHFWFAAHNFLQAAFSLSHTHTLFYTYYFPVCEISIFDRYSKFGSASCIRITNTFTHSHKTRSIEKNENIPICLNVNGKGEMVRKGNKNKNKERHTHTHTNIGLKGGSKRKKENEYQIILLSA